MVKYTEYKDAHTALARARDAYNTFVSGLGRDVSYEDHQEAGRLATRWEQAAAHTSDLRQRYFDAYPQSYSEATHAGHDDQVAATANSAAAAARAYQHHTTGMNNILNPPTYGAPEGFQRRSTPASSVSGMGGLFGDDDDYGEGRAPQSNTASKKSSKAPSMSSKTPSTSSAKSYQQTIGGKTRTVKTSSSGKKYYKNSKGDVVYI